MRVRLLKILAKTRRRLPVVLIAALLIALVPLTSPVPVAEAAPTGEMTLISDPDNFLNFTETGPLPEETVRIRFTNTAGAAITDVASTIQYVTLAAANLNPSRVEILSQAYWLIHDPSNSRPDLGPIAVAGVNETAPAYYSPYSTSIPVAIWHWNLGAPDGLSNRVNYTDSSQFASDLRILRPGEWVDLNITIRCRGVVGDSRIWFFPRATEFEPTSVPVTDLSTIPVGDDRMNIYYQNTTLPIRPVGWYPLHISYDPYDANIDSGTGHSFEQVGSAPLYGWTRIPTTTRFAKTNKLVHQTQVEDGGTELFPSTIHICGTKFLDLNGNGVYDPETEPGIDGVTVTLLGADAQTLASQYYPGNFTYPSPENQPPLDTLQSGENMLMGSYCFNLIEVKPGTYTFFVKILELDGLTTPMLIGPIVITVSDTSPATAVFSIDHDFGNLREVPPVGGVALSVDKLGLLAPWIGLLGVLGFLVSVVAVRKKRED